MSKPSFHEWLFAEVDWKISSGTMRGRRYTFDAFPCIYDITRDESHLISVMKSAQMALSEQFTLQRPFYHMAVHRRNWGIMFPGQGAMRDFFKTRIKGAIASNPPINLKVTATNETNVNAFDRALYLRYTSTETAIATFDADGITIDEQDLHNADTLYGAKTSRMQGAMGDIFWYEISTPTYPKAGIHQSFLDSDQHVWIIRCGGCRADNDLSEQIGPYDTHDIEEFFTEYLGEINFPKWEDYHIPCSKCGKPLDLVTPMEKTSDGSGGRWVARYPNRDVRGYHVQIFQRLYDKGSAMVLNRVRQSLLRAQKPTHRRRWYNFTLGVPYIPSEGRLGDDDLDLVTLPEGEDKPWVHGPFRHTYHIQGTHADWMGVDVRSGQYHVFALRRKSGDRRVVCCVGWVETSGEVRQLWELLGRPVFLQDADPDTNDTRHLVKGMGRRAKRAKFVPKTNALWTNSGGDEDLIIVARGTVMEAVKAAVTSGNWLFPMGSWEVGSGIMKRRGDDEYEETLKTHFKAPCMVKIEDHVTGNDIYDYPKDAMEGVDPHFYMAACLAYVASDMKAAPAYSVGIPR